MLTFSARHGDVSDTKGRTFRGGQTAQALPDTRGAAATDTIRGLNRPGHLLVPYSATNAMFSCGPWASRPGVVRTNLKLVRIIVKGFGGEVRDRCVVDRRSTQTTPR